ncbi:MAG TPA: CDP-alcohol phosphatidyltransferase family protein [Chthoniobacterales bacterium]|nr:CDP-alcohol phosphatidyltransferase family protein [Chthoniobacterales bacterium]
MNLNFDQVVILADESANWKIAGLCQLERLVLALDEFAKLISSQRKIDIFIFWRPDIGAEQRWRPQDPRLTRCKFVQSLSVSARERFLNTRLLVKRGGLEQLLHAPVPLENDPTIGDESAVWEKLWRRIENGWVSPGASQKSDVSRYLVSSRDIPRAERWLLRGSGKSRDGFVSRYLNRPISRAVSQLLLKTAMTPNVWTWLITLFPLIGFLFLIRGDYFGFVVGAAFFNIQSILDGCDGEIARAKYLDSEKGPGIDAFGDLIALLLFSIGLGFGLFRSAQPHAVSQWVFLSEGVLTFIFIALRLGPDHVLDLLRRGPAAVASTQDDERLRRSGGRIFGDCLTSWAFELTKRDVVFLAFLIVAALGLARWILHLLFAFALATLILSWQGRARRETMA